MANQKFPFKTMKPGEQHRVKVEPERYAHAMTAAASARYYWAKHYKVKLDVQLDTKASEVVYTMRKNPLITAAKEIAKALESKNPVAMVVDDPAYDGKRSLEQQTRAFFRDAFIACLTMNEPEKAYDLACEAMNIYHDTLISKENSNGAHA